MCVKESDVLLDEREEESCPQSDGKSLPQVRQHRDVEKREHSLHTHTGRIIMNNVMYYLKLTLVILEKDNLATPYFNNFA